MDARDRTKSYICTKIVLDNMLNEVILHSSRHDLYAKLCPEVKIITPQLLVMLDHSHCKSHNGMSDTQNKIMIYSLAFLT